MPRKAIVTVSKPSKIEEVRIVENVNNPRRRRRRSKRRPSRPRGIGRGLGPASAAYVASLCDPFDNPGTPLGWGCLQPTKLAQAYLRTAVNVNADGSVALVVRPSVTGLVSINASGVAVATWSSANATDNLTISANAGLGRVVSLGLRAFPSLAATANPGTCSYGALPGQSVTSQTGLTPNDLLSFPTSHVSRGYEGASCTGRPLDASSFEFYGPIIDNVGWSGNTLIPYSLPYIVFTGLPAGTSVTYEAVANFEYTPEISHLTAPMGQPDGYSLPSLADEWPSFEQMWSKVKNFIPTPGQSGETAASIWNAAKGPLMKEVFGPYMRGYMPQARPFMNTLADLADRTFGF